MINCLSNSIAAIIQLERKKINNKILLIFCTSQFLTIVPSKLYFVHFIAICAAMNSNVITYIKVFNNYEKT